MKEIPVVVCVLGTNDAFQQQVAQQTGEIWGAIPNENKKQQLYQGRGIYPTKRRPT